MDEVLAQLEECGWTVYKSEGCDLCAELHIDGFIATYINGQVTLEDAETEVDYWDFSDINGYAIHEYIVDYVSCCENLESLYR